ncbi:double-strand break repair protein MRE11-like [Homarus americanus]|uniref:Double-strand break repair protein n=1 Tax=Homarus americanus TaxID=6706 RepID=A0A8J5JTJ2_HOMAM|nr:double-strand break repair protein MRE11-like [Homarus americanus]XP_042234252.1 double-strand break repair protein MRE11-like [Homarus americanus]XP_042234253.1 double-strand break repair protein MRE11-like [Homarus americanus]KAG7162191.1 double-strand break repair protein MRE11-like [Homarus americanus]
MGAKQDDTFRILVATDNHIGYAENDPERGDDSLETFEEILQMAVEQKVDFILLGGDLFHENKPSRQCLVRCMDMIRKYTFGDSPVLFDFISDPVENFKHAKNPTVNYLDPNLNIAIPIFSIHGNHDDPSGPGQFCALEMLSVAGLVNYFGRTTDLQEIKISPLLLEKGQTKLAIYGLSSVKDERLFRLFRENKVKMLRPKESMESWFNIMVLHQNHAKHGPTNYIPESFLDPFLDLVIWGHEHECLIEPRLSAEDSFHVIQPGSSVATSLCAGEAVTKNVALLEVNNQQQFKTTALPLKTIRPFLFDNVCLADYDIGMVIDSNKSNPVEDFVEEYVHKMLVKVKGLITGHPRQPKKPLIRLRVEYTDESQMFNACRFGHRFKDDVANSTDMILFRKKKLEKKEEIGIDKDAMDAVFNEDVAETRVEDLVEQYFADLDTEHQLSLLTERGLARAIRSFVEKDDKDAIKTIIEHQVDKTRKYIMSLDKEFIEDKIESNIINYRQQRKSRLNAQQEENETLTALNDPNRVKQRVSEGDEDDEVLSDFDMDEEPAPKPARGRGSRGPRARGAKPRGSRGSRTASSTSMSTSSASSSKQSLTISGYGSPKVSTTASRARRGQGRGAVLSRNQNTMDSFCKPIQRPAASQLGPRGAVFDSDSD